MSKPKRLRDPNQLARLMVDIATGEAERQENKPSRKNSAAVEPGRLGGLKGGKSRAKKLTAERRSEIAKKAAEKRWQHKKQSIQYIS